MKLTTEQMKEMSRIFFDFKKEGIHVSFKDVAEVTFFDLERNESNLNNNSKPVLTRKLFDDAVDLIMNNDSWIRPYIVYDNQYLSLRKYSSEYIIGRIEIGKFRKVGFYG